METTVILSLIVLTVLTLVYPHTFLLDMACSTNIFTALSEFILQKNVSSHGSTKHPVIHLCFILLAGDIHPCPGPNYKYPWGTCHKPVQINQKGILCDLYNIWYHTKCINMSQTKYFRFGNCDEPWECNNCVLSFDSTDSFFNSMIHDTSGVSSHNTSNVSIGEETLFFTANMLPMQPYIHIN